MRTPFTYTLLFLLSLCSTAALSGCASDSGSDGAKEKTGQTDPSLSGEMINNPKTADQSGTAGVDQATVPVMTFERDKWDFGEIIQGEIVEYSFKFTNTGNSPLVITSAKGSCGCTVPEWPKEPISPGAVGYLKVTYDSNGRKDKFDKTVTITANTVPNTNLLYISGNVIVPES